MSIETDSKMTHIIELANNKIKTAIINILHMLKNKSKTKIFQNIQFEILETKIFEMKNTMDSSNSILHTVISKFEYITLGTTQIKQRKKKTASVACGVMWSSLIYTCNWSPRGEEVETKKYLKNSPKFSKRCKLKNPQFQEA